MRSCPIKWFKHDTDANMDAKLQEVLLDYGLEGYGLYWYCVELIAGKITTDNLTFELEHDARIIARNVGSTPHKIEEMMTYFSNLGLFENNSGTITCMKLARRLDQSMSGNPHMRKLISEIKGKLESKDSHDSVIQKDDSVMQDQIRLDQNRKDNNLLSDKSDAAKVLEYLVEVTGVKFRASTKSHIQNINARLSDGYTVEECKAVIDLKNKEWGKDQRMSGYLRPQTLFSASKFPGYAKAAKTNPARGVNQIGNNFNAPKGMEWE